MPADKRKTAGPELSTPPAESVRWQVTCVERNRASREDKGDVQKVRTAIVESRTWFGAREEAFRTFAAADGIYEPEDIEAIILPDGMAIELDARHLATADSSGTRSSTAVAAPHLNGVHRKKTASKKSKPPEESP